MESVLENYSTKGISFICGDTNSRTSTYNDFIKEDNLPDSLVALTSYSPDSQLSLRVNPDLKTNTWSLKLLSLCKSSGFPIVNGRHREGYANSFTYCGANGTSVNDYLITQEQNFELIRKFIVCSFTTFSDHAPLQLEFDSVQATTVNNRSNGIPENDVLTVIKWKDENKSEIREAFRVNHDLLNSCFKNRDLSSDADIDSCVESFLEAVVAIAEPFCKVTTRHKSGHKNAKLNFDKPWFSDELKTLRRNYIRALKSFNSNNSTNNHKTLNECKKTYKLKERYLKRQYMKQEGDMLSVIRKTNPKLCYAKFKPKKKTLKSNLKLDDFYEHFKNLGLEMNLDTDNASTEESNCCVFDELDAEITINEVVKVINLLKRSKSQGLDLLLNEYFIELCDFLLPFIVELFNAVLENGHFPKSWCDAIVIPCQTDQRQSSALNKQAKRRRTTNRKYIVMRRKLRILRYCRAMAQVLKPNCSLAGKSLIPIILRVKNADAEAVLELSRLKKDEPLESLTKVELIAQFEKLTGESVKDVLIVLCGKDDNIENLRLLVHESILLANSVGARGQRLSTSNPSTDTPAAKGSDGKAAQGDPSTTNQQLQAMRQDLDELKKNSKVLQVDEALSYVRTLAARPKLTTPGVLLAAIEMLTGQNLKIRGTIRFKGRQDILDAPPTSAPAFPFPGYGYQNPEFGFRILIFIQGQTIIQVVLGLKMQGGRGRRVSNEYQGSAPLAKKEKFEPEFPDWELKSGFDPLGVKLRKQSDILLVNYKGEITQPSDCLPSAEEVVNGSDYDFEDLSFLDPNFFKAGNLMYCSEQWEKIGCPERIANGSLTVIGRVGECDPPLLVLPITIEPSKPRMCHDERYLNLWIKDFPFSLDTLKEVPRLIEKDSFMASLDDKSEVTVEFGDFWNKNDSSPIHVKEANALLHSLFCLKRELSTPRVDAFCDNLAVVNAWSNQGGRDPSLNGVCERYSLFSKTVNMDSIALYMLVLVKTLLTGSPVKVEIIRCYVISHEGKFVEERFGPTLQI
ncbi:unnamed protein product [Mytilus edulis]|uniref:Uncharacterized protein n=1 Tax=Mytilus edulis TaxID=6550 RepID=A0A8S3R7E6_MYTED|nr:unnamed protein product [Mytilus edulis]